VKRVLTLHVPLALFMIALLFPFYWMLVTSLKSNAELYNAQANPLLVTMPSLSHYGQLFTRTLFARWSLNTIVVSVVSTFISLFAGTLAGYALARLRFRGGGVLGIVVFISYLVPPTLLFIPLAEVVRNLGLLDSPLALILTYPTFLIPFCTWLMMSYFKTIPRDLEDCARIDGATRVQAMVRVALPLAVPGILSAGIFAFTLSWNEFLYALVFITSASQKTIPVGVVADLIKGDVFYWGSLMAGALLGSVPVAIIYSFFVDHYVRALTGALKG
jgi:multiple sugar transport system permease protein